MPVEFPPDDPIRTDDDLVLRAGGGTVDNLVERALEHARDYRHLVEAGLCRSPWSISVHVPRAGRATKDELLAVAPYVHYRPYLQAEAAALLGLGFTQIIATTLVPVGVAPSPFDLCHYDVVVDAVDDIELAARIPPSERGSAAMTTQPTDVESSGDDSRPVKTFQVDLARFTTNGFGTLHGTATGSLHAGQRIAVTDDEADTLEAEDLAVRDGEAEIRVHWDRVLHRA